MQRTVEVTAAEYSEGLNALASWEGAGGAVQSYAATFTAAMDIMQRGERIVAIAQAWRNVAEGKIEGLPTGLSEFFALQDIGGHLEQAKTLGVDLPYRAAIGGVRAVVTGFRQVKPAGSAQLGAFPAIVAWGVVGVAAVAGATFWGVDRNEKQAEVKKFAIAANVSQYLKQVEAAVATGGPIPEPDDQVKAIAEQEDNWGIWQLGAGVLLGGAAAYGVMEGLKMPRRSNPGRYITRNTRPVSARVSTRSSRAAVRPRKNPARKKAAKRKATKKNPKAMPKARTTFVTVGARRFKLHGHSGEYDVYSVSTGRKIGQVMEAGSGWEAYDAKGKPMNLRRLSSRKAAISMVAGMRRRTNPSKRKATKKKTTKRKTTKRKVKRNPKRKAIKKKATKRKATKRKRNPAKRPVKRKVTKKKATKRRATKKRTTKRNPKRKATKRRVTKKRRPKG